MNRSGQKLLGLCAVNEMVAQTFTSTPGRAQVGGRAHLQLLQRGGLLGLLCLYLTEDVLRVQQLRVHLVWSQETL